MIDPGEQAKFDQASMTLAELLPPLWYHLFNNLKLQGFSEGQAFKLLQTYIVSQCPFGVRGDDG